MVIALGCLFFYSIICICFEVLWNYNRTFKHLDNEWMTVEEATRHTDDIRCVRPSITWSVECYHDVGEDERDVTYQETEHFPFTHCIDTSESLPRLIEEGKGNRVSLSVALVAMEVLLTSFSYKKNSYDSTQNICPF